MSGWDHINDPPPPARLPPKPLLAVRPAMSAMRPFGGGFFVFPPVPPMVAMGPMMGPMGQGPMEAGRSRPRPSQSPSPPPPPPPGPPPSPPPRPPGPPQSPPAVASGFGAKGRGGRCRGGKNRGGGGKSRGSKSRGSRGGKSDSALASAAPDKPPRRTS